MVDQLRDLPSVDFLLQSPRALALINAYGRPLTVEAIRCALAELRKQALAADKATDGQGALPTRILDTAAAQLSAWLSPSLIQVINATGVILHTNLGRAPLSRAAIRAVEQVAVGYSNLEFDLKRGTRGSRLVHAETLLQQLTGAQAALVVNNNAAAVLLVLTALARRKRVVISRGQLVEIGGGFRIPEVMLQSGAKLVEVGTTNRTHLRDYEAALSEPAALVMRAHPSNFRVIGFTAEPALAELAQAAHAAGSYLVDDLGSGALVDTARYGLLHEPTVQESLAAGADLVCFSGDKLLGGPQAGIIVGNESLIARLKKHPLARALRADKLCLAALSATLQHYLKDEAEREIPILRMLATPLAQIRSRAERWASVLGAGEVLAAQSTVGGGSLPEEMLPTFALAVRQPQPNKFLARLRGMNPPLIARVENEQVLFDPRTVMEDEEGALLAGLRTALGKV
jgi:L-seryl-tRNA(Ser) seleniumtransferase